MLSYHGSRTNSVWSSLAAPSNGEDRVSSKLLLSLATVALLVAAAAGFGERALSAVDAPSVGIGEIAVAQSTPDRHVVSFGAPPHTAAAEFSVVDAGGAVVADHLVTPTAGSVPGEVAGLDSSEYRVVVEWETSVETVADGVAISTAAIAVSPALTLTEDDVLVVGAVEATTP